MYTGNLTHCRQTLQLINPLTPMSDRGRISPHNINQISDEDKEKYKFGDKQINT